MPETVLHKHITYPYPSSKAFLKTSIVYKLVLERNLTRWKLDSEFLIKDDTTEQKLEVYEMSRIK